MTTFGLLLDSGVTWPLRNVRTRVAARVALDLDADLALDVRHRFNSRSVGWAKHPKMGDERERSFVRH